MSPASRQIALINVSHGFTHYALLILATAVLGMVAQEPGRFGSDYGPILALGTGMFVLYGVLSLPMGWLADRVGRRGLMAAHFLGTGGAMALAGAAPGPWSLGALLAVMGAFNAIYHPIGTAMLVEAAGEKVGRSVGLNGVCGNVGVALAPVVTAAIAATLGWRWGFVLPGLACMAVGLLWLREAPLDLSGRLGGGKPFPAIPRPVVRRAVMVLLSIAFASGFVFNAFTLLLPKLMQERLAATPNLLPVVGMLAFAATLFGGVTQFTVGRMLDRTTLKRVFMPLAVIQVPALLALALVQGWVVLPLAALLAASIFGQVTVNETMTARYVAPALRARLYSVRFFVGFLGAAAASPLVGLLHDMSGSLGVPLLVLAGFGLVTLVCALFFPDRKEELRPELWTQASPVPAE